MKRRPPHWKFRRKNRECVRAQVAVLRDAYDVINAQTQIPSYSTTEAVTAMDLLEKAWTWLERRRK